MDVQSKGVVAELRTPIYITFVIAVATASYSKVQHDRSMYLCTNIQQKI